MKKYWYWDEHDTVLQLMNTLNNGDVVAGTSDTVVGLLASVTGKNLLDHIKQRTDKPYIVLVHDMHKAAQFSSMIMNAKLQPLLKALWPGPLTVIVHATAQMPDYVTSHDGTLALRVPNHAGLQKVLVSCEGLFSTSANVTGMPVATSVAELAPEIVRKSAMIIDDRIKKESKPSTIIDCTGPNVKLVREGAYPIALLKKYITLDL